MQLKKIRIIPSVVLLTFCLCHAKAQNYKGAVGGRFGYGTGISGLYHVQNGHVLEFLLRYGYHGLILNKPGFNVQALYQKHWAFRKNDAWTVFVGVGPAIGFGKKNHQSTQKFVALGVSPQFGIDYTTHRLRIPFVLALDYKPTLNGDFAVKNKSIKPKADFSYYEIAFSARFGIGENNRKRYKRR
ncbi:MAG: hypothetical protein R2807_08400 [Chitinophagales bacterium]